MKIECQNINKSYIEEKSLNKNNVLKEIDLQILAGETIALTGPSGSGKTTLLNIISGLDEPTSGNVLFDSKSMQKFDLNQRTKFRNHNREKTWILFIQSINTNHSYPYDLLVCCVD